MMSLDAINEMADEQAELAAEANQIPYVYWNAEDVTSRDRFPFPNLGSFCPDGWEEVDRHMCDSSGWGTPAEPAMTPDQLIEFILERIAEFPGTGWAIVQEAQFQLYVGAFQKVQF